MDTDDASPRPTEAPARAAVLLIGDELLSGKIRDDNGYFLAQTMRRRGIALVEIRTVGDDIAGIGHALLQLVGKASIVFTSGGVGPTHDDRTLAAIAAATGRPLTRHAELEAQLRAHYGARINEAALRMADLPEGTQLRAGPGWPVMRLDVDEPRSARIYILPGVPGLLRAKVERLESLPDELPRGTGWHLEDLFTTLDESALARHLDAVVAGFPAVEVGSYPRWTRGEDGRVSYHVRVTLEGLAAAADQVAAARAALVAALPADQILAEAPPTA
jgi:molybdenum cofactor synthesis domain-containing protein